MPSRHTHTDDQHSHTHQLLTASSLTKSLNVHAENNRDDREQKEQIFTSLSKSDDNDYGIKRCSHTTPSLFFVNYWTMEWFSIITRDPRHYNSSALIVAFYVNNWAGPDRTAATHGTMIHADALYYLPSYQLASSKQKVWEQDFLHRVPNIKPI